MIETRISSASKKSRSEPLGAGLSVAARMRAPLPLFLLIVGCCAIPLLREDMPGTNLHRSTLRAASASIAHADEPAAKQFTASSNLDPRAPEPQRWTPQVCTSLDPVSKRVGIFGVLAPLTIDSCPKGWAYVSQIALNSYEANAFQNTPLQGNCCQLPPDALTETIHYFVGRCPAGSVATGVRTHSTETFELAPDLQWTYLLECTFINTSRYQLGPESLALRVTPAPYAFNRHSMQHLFGLDPHVTIMWNTVPAGLRYSAGRFGKHGREQHHCVGYPWGSLLVGRGETTNCGYLHQQLQYTGKPGDPERGTPVQIFPDCDAIEDPEGESPKCIRLRAQDKNPD